MTNPTRTLVDLAKVFNPTRLKRVIEHALVTRKVRLQDLVELVAALSRQGKPGMTKLQTIIREYLLGIAVSDTELERAFFQLLKDAGLPLPTRQFHAPWLKPLNGRGDFAYVDLKIVIEAEAVAGISSSMPSRLTGSGTTPVKSPVGWSCGSPGA